MTGVKLTVTSTVFYLSVELFSLTRKKKKTKKKENSGSAVLSVGEMLSVLSCRLSLKPSVKTRRSHFANNSKNALASGKKNVLEDRVGSD